MLFETIKIFVAHMMVCNDKKTYLNTVKHVLTEDGAEPSAVFVISFVGFACHHVATMSKHMSLTTYRFYINKTK